MAKVSIIVPTYNVETYLHQCMTSLHRQTLQDIEIICVNDGSTDGSLEILREYAERDSRIVIIDKENGGYGKAMNVGLEQSTGEYIGILEPDDYVPLEMYEDLYNVAKTNDLDFVKADFYRFKTEENGNMQLTYNHLDITNQFYNQVLNPSITPELITLIMNTWSGIYKRDFLEKYHIRHNETPGASFQDNGFFWQTFIHAERAMFLDKPYYMNRRDNPNSSVNSKDKVYCMNIEYDFIRDLLMKEPEEIWERFKGHYNLKRYHNYMFTLNRIGDAFKREYVERIAAEYRRSRDLDELDMEVFTKNEQDKLLFMMKSPGDYYLKYCLMKGSNEEKVLRDRLRKAENRVKLLENSTTFKVGKIIMYIPTHIKDAIIKRTAR